MKPWSLVAERFREAGEDLLALAGGRLSNEDLFNLRQLSRRPGRPACLVLYMAGGDLMAQVGVGQGTNFGEMGPETAILVVACDLEEEAPLWWLRVKQAAERGANLIVVNPRPTKLDRMPPNTLRYPYGAEAATVLAMVNALSAKRPDLPGAAPLEPASSNRSKRSPGFRRSRERGHYLRQRRHRLARHPRPWRRPAPIYCGHKPRRAAKQRPDGGLVRGRTTRAPGTWASARLKDYGQAFRSQSALRGGGRPCRRRPLPGRGLQRWLPGGAGAVPDRHRQAGGCGPAGAVFRRAGRQLHLRRAPRAALLPRHPAMPSGVADFAITAEIGRGLGMDLEGRAAARVMGRIAAANPGLRGIDLHTAERGQRAVADRWAQRPILRRDDLRKLAGLRRRAGARPRSAASPSPWAGSPRRRSTCR